MRQRTGHSAACAIVAGALAFNGACGGDEGPFRPGGDQEEQPPAVTSVTLNLERADLMILDSLDVVVVVLGASGDTLSGRPVTYNSDRPDVATVDTNGRVVGVGVGEATISVTVEAHTDVVNVTVWRFAQVVAGNTWTCALSDDGRVWCWGHSQFGVLGREMSIIDSPLDPFVVETDLRFKELAGSLNHACGITQTGIVYCWGYNSRGQLGDSTTVSRFTPTRALIAPDPVAGFALGDQFSCAWQTGGTITCWGKRLEERGPTVDLSPFGLNGEHGVVSAGGSAACVLRDDETVYCLGGNALGQLGLGKVGQWGEGVLEGTGWSKIDLGFRHACGMRAGRSLCWGMNEWGQLGDGTKQQRLAPTQVSGSLEAVALSVGSAHTCALSHEGAAHCWGSAVASGSTGGDDRLSPAPIVTDLRFESVLAAPGGAHSCAIEPTGRIYCWGRNGERQLGIGSALDSTVPKSVRLMGS